MTKINDKLYLRANVVLEPLVNQWYAWPHLISPMTSSMILDLQLKIMESFIKAPKMHISNAKLMPGGLFLNCEENQVKDILNLIEKTKQKNHELLAFAEGVRELNKYLIEHAEGDSLSQFYDSVPTPLKGYIELGYDLYNNPSIRFFEALLYHSKYYNLENQSISLYLADYSERAFVLSTPRLHNSKKVTLNIPFNHDIIDKVFASRDKPINAEIISEMLNLSDDKEKDRPLIESFFTKDFIPPEALMNKIDENHMHIRYFNHATLLVNFKDCTILTDPIVGYKSSEAFDNFSFDSLPSRINYVLLTHAHQDHVVLETLLQLRHKIDTIVVPKNNSGFLQDPSLRLALINCGFLNVIELGEMETIKLPHGSITAIPSLGEHGDLHIASKLGFVIEGVNKKILIGADSNNIQSELYDHIHSIIGKIDCIFLGMECEGAPMSWLYGPLMTKPLSRKFDQNRRLNGSNCERALQLIKRFSPKSVYIYAMGEEPWLTFISSIKYTEESAPIIESNKLIQNCLSQGIYSERLYMKKDIII